VKRHESQIGELNHLKLKTVVLHSDQDGEIHITQLVGFVVVKSILVG